MSHEEIDAHMKSKRKTVSSYRVKICITIGMLAHGLAIGLVHPRFLPSQLLRF